MSSSHSHAHSHTHSHNHHHTPKSFTRAFAIATTINLLFVIAEVFYAYLGDSMSLLADAAHNLVDVAGLALAGLASLLVKKAATPKYSYGFKRTTLLATLCNAVLLISSTLFILGESVYKLLHPVFPNEKIMMIVAAIGIAINGGTALLFIKGQQDLNIKSAFLHLAYDALLSLGVVVVGALILITHWIWLDPVVGAGIALTIFFGTWGLLKQALALNLDAVPSHINEKKIRAYFEKLPELVQIHHLHIWALSTQEVALTVHLVFPQHFQNETLLAKIQEDLLHDFDIHHVTVQVETPASSACRTC